MAEVKISGTGGLPAGVALTGTEAFPADQGSPPSTVYLTAAQIRTYASSNTVATPSQITADQNDYAGATADVNRLSSDAARNITGFSAGVSGQAILLVNVGSFAITLKHQNTGSTAANRVIVPWAGDCVLAANGGSVTLVYDATDLRWRAQGLTNNYTLQKTITSGTAAPTGGSDGDIYLRYT